MLYFTIKGFFDKFIQSLVELQSSSDKDLLGSISNQLYCTTVEFRNRFVGKQSNSDRVLTTVEFRQNLVELQLSSDRMLLGHSQVQTES